MSLIQDTKALPSGPQINNKNQRNNRNGIKNKPKKEPIKKYLLIKKSLMFFKI